MKNAIVTGASSGLGKAICVALTESSPDWNIIHWDRDNGFDVRHPSLVAIPSTLDLLINCAGINRIDWLPHVCETDWDDVMDVNAKGIFLMTQACLRPLQRARGTVLNIVSNAAHMPMRCSAAYNASKGAALILTKQLARELAPDITVFSVSPNKLAGTGMSDDIDRQVMKTRGWTREEAQAYQLKGLLTGQETDPAVCAEFIAFLLSSKERHKYLAGCDIPYGA